MSRNYDNWERLVDAVLKKELIWELCHQSSTSPSICSEASSISDFSSRFRLSDLELGSNQESPEGPLPKLLHHEGLLKRTRRLGTGRFGTSILTELQRGVQLSDQQYLAEGTQLVLKKLRTKKVKMSTEEEFKTVFGNCTHANVAAPRAYYFSNNGNYVFNDYHSPGSLYDMLHGKSDCRLNWESRLKIAVGAARGIAYIHRQRGGNWAHGNVKSSNIFLNSEQYGCVFDFGLADIIVRSGKWVVVGHQYSLEYKLKICKAAQERDVYSFGVVLLQLLSGKLQDEPQGYFRRNFDPARPDHWGSKLFDQSLWSTPEFCIPFLLCDELDMFKYEEKLEARRKTNREMEEMLQVAMKCLSMIPQNRPNIFEVVNMLENLCSKPRSRITTKLNCCLLRQY